MGAHVRTAQEVFDSAAQIINRLESRILTQSRTIDRLTSENVLLRSRAEAAEFRERRYRHLTEALEEAPAQSLGSVTSNRRAAEVDPFFFTKTPRAGDDHLNRDAGR